MGREVFSTAEKMERFVFKSFILGLLKFIGYVSFLVLAISFVLTLFTCTRGGDVLEAAFIAFCYSGSAYLSTTVFYAIIKAAWKCIEKE